MTTPPVFNDGSTVEARQSPSQTQGESPTGSVFTNDDDGQRAAFEQWKRDQQRQQDDSELVKEDTTNVVSTSRKVPTEATKSEAPVQKVEDDVVPQSYVWLANGEVVKANDEDLPGKAGHGAEYGFWQKDGSVHTIVAVYPVEENAEGN